MDALLLIAALALLLIAQSFLLRRFALCRLTYSRFFDRKAGFAGETAELTEVIENKKLLPLPWLRAESRMSSSLRFEGGKQDDRAISADDAQHLSVFSLAPYQRVTRRHRVMLLRRGRYEIGSVALTAGDLFGLGSSTLQADTGAAISVYPRLLSEAELAELPSSRWQGDLVVKRWIMPDPFLVSGIREWREGDPERDIHWGATARTGRLQVKSRDYTADPKLLVLLNVQKAELQWGDLMEYEQGAIERGISLAATLCLRALHAGIEAGFAANAPASMEANAKPVVLLPARHAGREEALLEMFARLRILRARNFPTFLSDLGRLTGLDILILSAYDSALVQEGVRHLRAMGNSVALHLLTGREAAG